MGMPVNIEQIYNRIAEIVVEYASELNYSHSELNFQGFKEFLMKDENFKNLIYRFSEEALSDASKTIMSQLDILEIYIGKDKAKYYKSKFQYTEGLDEFVDIVSMIFYDLYENFDSVNHSFIKLINFLNSLNTKVVKSHDNMISTVDSSIKNLKNDHITEKKIMTDMLDINKILNNSNLDIIGKSVMEKVDNVISLVEKNIENKIKQIDKYEKILKNLKTDIAIYERQTKILEAEIKKAKKETITDEKTGLYSYRMIPFRLSEEDEKFFRKNIPYSIMIMRVQNIEFEDEQLFDYVHGFIMTHLADLVRNCIRKVDIPCVYKNDGILIIMPETDIAACEIVGKRILNSVKNTVFKYQDMNVRVALGLSCIMKSEGLKIEDILQLINEKYEEIIKSSYFKII